MEALWTSLISKLHSKPQEFKTTPKNGKTPVWFSAYTDGTTIYVNSAKVHTPSSKLNGERKLTYDEFERIYPIHLKREAGQSVTAEATNVTFNQVYWFSLIKHCLDK